jgi:hypothetical protein
LAWTGKTFGIEANHIWRLKPRDGKTIVRTEESWEGLVANIFRARMERCCRARSTRGFDV